MNEAGAVAPPPIIRLGWRMRIAMMIPSVNTVAEPQMAAMLPEGVSLHTTRLKLTGSTEEELLGMVERTEEAALLLADAMPHRILFHCTAVTTFDPEMAVRIRARITEATGIAADVTSEGVVAALRALRAHRIVLISPYIQPVNDREVGFLHHHGFEVLSEYGLGLPGGRAFATVEPSEWYRIAMAHRHADADAYFLSCAQTRTAEIIEALEYDLGRPVVTSNTAAVWHCLRQGGLRDAVPGFGGLMRLGGERA